MRYPRGKISPDDEGELSIALAADTKNGLVRMVFAKPTMWIAMEKDVALDFANKIIEKANQIDDNNKPHRKPSDTNP